ncbi:major facilitator superfamily domain-containing protein [Leucosporidium creatinivorum]|uniref:Major facilitator superfamily domain-containing protein n=1 Tax=Leucosporidium creatinivorum TaxID=106004 RepID=A0A1Y2DW33_9BASI|nr:major facilitator superfamily domain-containing protein [Leucosporidium creatinivorum]
MADNIANQQQQERRESEDEKRSSLESPHPQDNLAGKEQSPATPVAHKGEPTFKSRGVIGVEAMARSAATSKKGKYSLYALAVLIYILQWVAAMASSMTGSLSVFATSHFQQHSSGLSTLSVATSIIGSVCLPFLAKGSDVFGRPGVYAVCMVLQVIGYVITLKSPTLAAYVVGNVFSAIGSSGFDLMNSILMADLTPLKWRGLAMGLLTSPYLVTVWYTSEIVEALSTEEKWRWGYGMFAIIYPVFFIPAIAAMFWLERRALKDGLINVELARTGVDDAAVDPAVAAQAQAEQRTIRQKLYQLFQEVDTIGLLLLGFGWSLLLLPFSLYGGARGGFKNNSLIAMLAIGSACLIAYPLYEWKWAKFPSMPKRILLNRSFVTAVVINFVYMLAAYLQLLYLSSYVYIVTDIDVTHWNYYNNVQNMGLCGVAIIAGFLFKATGRFKLWQIFGLCIRIIGYGLLVDKNGVHNYGRLVMSQLLAGAGSAFSSLGSQVAAQASVPHQDLGLVVSLLLLWSSIGASVGDAIAGQYWGSRMPGNLRQYLPASINDTEVESFYADITTIKEYDFGSLVREGATKAYEVTVFPLWSAALGLSFVCLICACFQSNFFLGDAQNSYDHKDTSGHVVADDKDEHVERKTLRQKILRVWDW